MYRDSIELYEKLTSGDTEDIVLRSRLEAYLKAIIDKGISLGGGSGNIVPLTVTADGVFEATDGVDGYSPVTVTALAEAEAQVGYILDIINGEVVGEDTGDK